MTKVEQVRKNQTKNSPMAYLTQELAKPTTFLLEEVVARLNKQEGVRPVKAARFNFNIVVNIYYGKYEDHNKYVELELIKMVLEEKGLTDHAKPHLDALRKLALGTK